MSKITLRQAAAWCGGRVEPQYEDVAFLGAGNDTRKIQPGQLFVALEGVRDGHDFIDAAFEKGAAAVLCKHCRGAYPALIVEDPRIALGQIAAGMRQAMGMKVVGVTGSVGKSTTKEMIAAVLQGSYIVSKTPANFNNDLGMPMSILAMPEDTQVAVLEMGMNHFGEIRYLTNIAKPDVAVIINVGTMHVENLGSRQGILQAKLEILEGVSRQGVVCLNGDNDMLQSCDPGRPVTWFGTGAHCAVRGEHVREGEAGLSFDVVAGEETFSVTLPLEGLHYVSDALAACVGGIGIAPGANINYLTGHAVFEATHGTAPKYAGMDKVNPCSLTLSGEMLLRHLGFNEAAELVTRGIEKAISDKVVTYDFARLMTGAQEVSCSAFARAVVDRM